MLDIFPLSFRHTKKMKSEKKSGKKKSRMETMNDSFCHNFFTPSNQKFFTRSFVFVERFVLVIKWQSVARFLQNITKVTSSLTAT